MDYLLGRRSLRERESETDTDNPVQVGRLPKYKESEAGDGH